YLWSEISGPSSTITDTASATTTIKSLQQGSYQFELTVTDDKGAKARDTMTLTVNAASNTIQNQSVNQAPIANAGNDLTIVSSNSSVKLTGNGTDKDGNITGYYWKQLSGPSIIDIIEPASATPTISNLIGGTYSFELTVTDNGGKIGKDTMNVTVALARIASKVRRLNVFPNPVRDFVNVEVTTSHINTYISIIISDMSGTIVYKKEFVSNPIQVSQRIDMSNLVKGVYVITVFFDEMEKQSAKVIRL
ncbi:MAG: T9SS type A sorting domain-containing protein, partial [Ginsengibacter sp.]